MARKIPLVLVWLLPILAYPPGLLADAVLDEVTSAVTRNAPQHAGMQSQIAVRGPGSLVRYTLERSRSVSYLDRVKALPTQ